VARPIIAQIRRIVDPKGGMALEKGHFPGPKSMKSDFSGNVIE